MIRFRIRVAWRHLVFAMLFGTTQAALAQPDPKIKFSIPAQSAAKALEAFARQAKVQIVYPHDLAAAARANGIEGELTRAEALAQLLAGTGLEAERISPDTVAVRSASGGRAANPTRLAQAATDTARAGASESRPAKGEKIEITGSRLARPTEQGPQNVQVYGREEIDRSGQTTLQGFLNTLPEVSTAGGENPFELFGGQTSVRLRGLPLGTTLVLLNGRRIEVSGSTVGGVGGMYFDLTNIPAAAIERIEILAESSSAIYGSDALGGVVNVILKQRMEGGEVTGRYDHASGYGEGNASLAWGHRWDRASLTFVGSWLQRSELTAWERALTADADYRRVGGFDRRFMNCNPGTVFSSTTANLPGLNSRQAAIPAGITGRPSVQDFAAGAGGANLCSRFNEISLVPELQRGSVLVSGAYQLGPSTELFGDVIFSRINRKPTFNYPALSNTVIPATNAFNPFGTAVRVSYEITDLPRGGVYSDVDFWRVLGGAKGALGRRWDWEVAAWLSRDDDHFETLYGVPTPALTAALASSNPATAFNPFATHPASPEILQSLYSSTVLDAQGEKAAVSAQLRGELVELPAGAVSAVVGAELARDRVLSSQPVSNFLIDAYRRSRAFFAEARAPLLASTGKAYEILALTAAVRRDHFNDYGDSNTHQAGIEVRPAAEILLRASYGTAFRAPSMGALFSPLTTIPSAAVADPRRGNQASQATVILGGNPDLQAETGSARSAGVAWAPSAIKGLQALASVWQIEQDNRVASIGFQTIVNNEEFFPGRVTRAAGTGGQLGAITTVDARYANFGKLDVRGIDLRLSYRFATPFGDLSPSVAVTNIRRYLAAVNPNAPITDRLGVATTDGWAPRWKGAAILGWKQGAHSASISGRYVSRYKDYGPLPSGATNYLGDFWTWDVTGRSEVGRAFFAGSKWFSGLHVSAGVLNVRGKQPPYSSFSVALAFDPSQYDIVGRRYFLALGTRF